MKGFSLVFPNQFGFKNSIFESKKLIRCPLNLDKEWIRFLMYHPRLLHVLIIFQSDFDETKKNYLLSTLKSISQKCLIEFDNEV